jgi:hypothetical protein
MIAKSEAARAIERIQNIMDQLRAFECGDVTEIHCPYCAGVNTPVREDFCCSMFAKSCMAALERLRVEQSTEVCERIMVRHRKN